MSFQKQIQNDLEIVWIKVSRGWVCKERGRVQLPNEDGLARGGYVPILLLFVRELLRTPGCEL